MSSVLSIEYYLIILDDVGIRYSIKVMQMMPIGAAPRIFIQCLNPQLLKPRVTLGINIDKSLSKLIL
jgi:hypothetical protein